MFGEFGGLRPCVKIDCKGRHVAMFFSTAGGVRVNIPLNAIVMQRAIAEVPSGAFEHFGIGIFVYFVIN